MHSHDTGETRIPICASSSLEEGGRGVRFPVHAGGGAGTGFAVRYDGKVYAYLNRCAHVPIELDWNEGDFFDSTGLYLMCSTHGALYTPDTGACVGGPCRNGKLRPIDVLESDGQVFWCPDAYIRPTA